MKKVLLSLILFVITPISVLAADYDIKNYYIEANILENGDMDVSELIVLKGLFNGYERDIIYSSLNDSLYNASGLTNLSISGKKYDGKVSFDSFKESYEPFISVDSANNGDSNKYVKSLLNGGYRYRMYYKTNRSTTAFLIKYTLKDVVILHDDCAEVYWNFIGNDFEDVINDLNIKINLPGKDTSDVFRWWFHGSLTGNSKKDETENITSIVAKLNENNEYEPVDSRILFSKELVNENLVQKKTNNQVIDSITQKEDEIVKRDLETIANNKKIFAKAEILTGLFYILLVVSWVIVYIKYDKERKPQFQNDYNREFIDDYNVEVIDFLMNKSITPNAMSASIMNMIYKKNIEYEEVEGSKKDYKFILKNRDNLNETEQKLIDFLFITIGNGEEFTTKELKSYASSTRTCNKFMNSYTSWQRQVESDGKKENFFETGIGRAKYGFFIFLLSLIVTGYVAMNNVEFFPSYFCVFAAVIFVVYLLILTKKTEKGIEHYAKWKAFKKFLEDFGTFDTKELPEIVLWERYLVYATVFGLADKVEKVMNVKIHELEMSDNMNTMIYIHPHFNIAPVINSSINSAYHGAQTAITREAANASGGSFGGHGGGFSSGGGFGGGGGGGRGF